MKRLLAALCVCCLVASCAKTPTARINATVEGANDTSIVIYKLVFNHLQTVDTVKTDAGGKFDYKVKLTGNAPYFYYLYYGQSPVASLVLLPGDKVTLTSSASGQYEVEGSQESSFLKEVNTNLAEASAKMDKVLEGVNQEDEASVKAGNAALSKIYVDYKRTALKFVMQHPYSIASAVTLFQKFGEELPVFNEASDVIVMNQIKDSLATVYPSSEFVVALRDEVERRSNILSLSNRLESAEAVNFPDIVATDVEGITQYLSAFDGKVIVLSFWSVAQETHKMFNNELVEIYNKYHERGLEIFQMGLDVDKPTWAAAVKNQKLPWVNVNDGLGVDSPAVVAYRVDHVPYMIVMDREGAIIGTDVYDGQQLAKLIEKAL